MDTTFPLGLPAETQFYLGLYLLTLVIHVFLMTYVLAGSGLMAWAVIFPGLDTAPRTSQPLFVILRDWSPFVLSGAITAAIAPLLFVQILYPQQFYTANLLLGWRWMVVIPVLIAAFYLLYLIKSPATSRWNIAVRALIVLAAMICFVFVAFCWTTNHLLSITPESWITVYVQGDVVGSYYALLTRLATWISGSFPTLSALAGWQLAYYKAMNDAEELLLAQEPRRLASVSLVGLLVALGFALLYLFALPGSARAWVLGPQGRLWIGLLAIGILGQAGAWWVQGRLSGFRPKLLTIITLGSLLTLVATGALREVIRLSQVDLILVNARAAEASNVQGLVLFLIFALINLALIASCVVLIRSRLKPTESLSPESIQQS